ncbi:MAG: hypothetical protein U0165_14815 [Polyangiaceae bacterium]
MAGQGEGNEPKQESTEDGTSGVPSKDRPKVALKRRPLVRKSAASAADGAPESAAVSEANTTDESEDSAQNAVGLTAPAATPPSASDAAVPASPAPSATPAQPVAASSDTPASKAKQVLNDVIAKAKAGNKGVLGGLAAFGVFVVGGFLYMVFGGGGGAAKLVTDPLMGSKTLLAANECDVAGRTTKPLVVDWDPDDLGALEAQMKDGIAVLSYSCSGIQVLTDCKVKEAPYRFVGVTTDQSLLELTTSDEVAATLPKLSSSIQASASTDFFKQGKISISQTRVGMRSTSVGSLSKGDLQGAGCSKATHYVHDAIVGAFSIEATSAGSAKAAASAAGASNTAESKISKLSGRKKGSQNDCNNANPNASNPPGNCGALLRLTLYPIDAKGTPMTLAAGAAVGGGGCAKGLVYSGGMCVEPKKAKAYQCDPSDPSECQTQCDRGDGVSCAILGDLLTDSLPNPTDDYDRALKVYTAGCGLKNQHSCAWQGYYQMTSLGTKGPQVESLVVNASNSGDASAAYAYGLLIYKGLIKGTSTQSLDLYQRSCTGGYSFACRQLGSVFALGLLGQTKDFRQAENYFKLACRNGLPTGCIERAYLQSGAVDGAQAAGVAINAATSISSLDESCSGHIALACSYLADIYTRGINGKIDLDKAKSYREKSCKEGNTSDCAAGDNKTGAPRKK